MDANNTIMEDSFDAALRLQAEEIASDEVLDRQLQSDLAMATELYYQLNAGKQGVATVPKPVPKQQYSKPITVDRSYSMPVQSRNTSSTITPTASRTSSNISMEQGYILGTQAQQQYYQQETGAQLSTHTNVYTTPQVVAKPNYTQPLKYEQMGEPAYYLPGLNNTKAANSPTMLPNHVYMDPKQYKNSQDFDGDYYNPNGNYADPIVKQTIDNQRKKMLQPAPLVPEIKETITLSSNAQPFAPKLIRSNSGTEDSILVNKGSLNSGLFRTNSTPFPYTSSIVPPTNSSQYQELVQFLNKDRPKTRDKLINAIVNGFLPWRGLSLIDRTNRAKEVIPILVASGTLPNTYL